MLTIYDVLLGDADVNSVIQATEFEGLHVLPADKNLVGANLELIDREDREQRLRSQLTTVKSRFHFILIDCPPALDLLTLNALMAADSVLIPIQCEFFALEGISQLMDTIDRIRESLQHNLRLEGILLTMYDDRTNLTRQVENDLRDFFGNEVLRTVIPRSVRLAEAPSHGKPILSYDVRSRGAESYIKLAKEILEHEQAAGQSKSAGYGAFRTPAVPYCATSTSDSRRSTGSASATWRDAAPNRANRPKSRAAENHIS
jgi:chromosome partitioning protein